MIKKGQQDRGIMRGALAGSAAALLLSMVFSAALATLVCTGKAGEESETALVAVSGALAAAAGTMIAWGRNGGRALLSGITAVLITSAARIVLTLFSGKPFTPAMLGITCSMLGGSILTGIIASGKKRRRR